MSSALYTKLPRYDDTPKSVFAAIVHNIVINQTKDKTQAAELIYNTWKNLHQDSLVKQPPLRPAYSPSRAHKKYLRYAHQDDIPNYDRTSKRTFAEIALALSSPHQSPASHLTDIWVKLHRDGKLPQKPLDLSSPRASRNVTRRVQLNVVRWGQLGKFCEKHQISFETLTCGACRIGEDTYTEYGPAEMQALRLAGKI